jgi:Tfp pilus assembly protein PilF
LTQLDNATSRSPHTASYWLRRGKFLEQVKQLPMAKESYDSGLANDPRAYDVLVAAARLAKAQGDASALDRYQSGLHELDPSDGWRAAVAS